MFDGYSLHHLIDECVDERSAIVARDQSLSSRKALYEAAWEALNSWIVYRLRKRKVTVLSENNAYSFILLKSIEISGS